MIQLNRLKYVANVESILCFDSSGDIPHSVRISEYQSVYREETQHGH